MSELKKRMAKELKKINKSSLNCRSAWDRGVGEYADEIMEVIEGYKEDPENFNGLKAQALNGAKNWYEYSWSGNSLCYDSDIAERLCTPSQLKKTHGGERKPNKDEDWLDVQARGLQKAFGRVARAYSIAVTCLGYEKMKGDKK